MTIRILRRSFLAGLGGLAIGSFAYADEPSGKLNAPPPHPSQPAAQTPDGLRPNVFVHVAPDGLVTIACARAEMGQGVRSSLPVLVADELGADMAHVKIVQADGDKAFGDQNTDGSHSVRGLFDEHRRVGAAARMMLIAAAAQKWGVPPAACRAEGHAVVHPPTKRTLGFGELANAAGKLKVPAKEAIVLRPLSELPHLGKELPLLDGPDVVTGRATYGADVKLPGMLTAVVARPPVVGGTVKSSDTRRAAKVPGVKKIVTLPSPKRPFAFQPLGGIAVVATDTWSAMRGRDALDVTWDPGDNGNYDSRAYKESLVRSVSGGPGAKIRNVGDVDAALASAAKKVEALYYVPHLPHATMEPPVAIARADANGCEVWTCTQNPQDTRTQVAKSLGIDESKVTVHVTLLGGGFGRKSKPDYAAEAALVSREVGAPVRLQWTREDDLHHDYYHTVSAQRLVAGLDAKGAIVAWQHKIAFPPIASTFKDAAAPGPGDYQQGILDVPLAIPNVRAEGYEARGHVRIGWLRSVANIYHAFAVQSFIDELAHARGVDPKQNLFDVLGAPRVWNEKDLGVDKLPNYGQSLGEHPVDTARHRRVIERVTELARWDDRKKDGRALGLAVHRSFLTYVAVVISVVKDERNGVRVDEAWLAADPGIVVNMERVKSQLEGAIVMGIGQAMFAEMTMKDGATEQHNFRELRLLRMPEAPRRIHVDVLPSTSPPGGIGEPGIPPTAPALANAIFALTGQRIREVPFIRALSSRAAPRSTAG